MSDAWNNRVEHLLRQVGTRVHAPNGLPIRCIRADGLMLEHEDADHRDYLFPVEAESSDPPEYEDGRVLWWNKATHVLIYTDGNVALTLHEKCYHLWHLSRDGVFLSGMLHDDTWRLTVPSVEKILVWCREHDRINHLHPNARYLEPEK